MSNEKFSAEEIYDSLVGRCSQNYGYEKKKNLKIKVPRNENSNPPIYKLKKQECQKD